MLGATNSMAEMVLRHHVIYRKITSGKTSEMCSNAYTTLIFITYKVKPEEKNFIKDALR